MGVLGWLFGGKPKSGKDGGSFRRTEDVQVTATKTPIHSVAAGQDPAADHFPQFTETAPIVLNGAAASAVVSKDEPELSANIWDFEPENTSAAQHEPDPKPHHRSTRTKTRVLGFEQQLPAVAPLLDEGRIEDDGQASSKAFMVMFPVGWLLIKAGAGRGAVFPISQGISHIGRGLDQTVALDFGDMAISRQNHAAVAYDASTHEFRVGHGGKSNLVRLNGKPLLSTEVMVDGDEIQIGETTLFLKVLCTPVFNWSAGEAGGDGHDMAIA